VQAAVNAMDPQLATIHVCPGTFIGNSAGDHGLDILRPVTVIGAGDGPDDGANTILLPGKPSQAVLRVDNTETELVHLEGLRFTGGTGVNGRGGVLANSTVTMTNCTVTGNHRTIAAEAGLAMFEAKVTFVNTHITDNSSEASAGLYVQNGTELSLDVQSRVTRNTNTTGLGYGGIDADSSSKIFLASAENVTGNAPSNCGGTGEFSGPGAICTSS
jgi:hypothetical protein